MPARKTAIAVPPELLREVDAAASARGESRSAFINRVLRAAVRARRDAEITRRLDLIFAEPEARAAQAMSSAALDEAGTAWNDERW